MKVEIWSDVVCPFCYIGKRKFETALQQFAHRDKIAMEWKSFQLMPDIPTTLNKSIDQVLSETKGISMVYPTGERCDPKDPKGVMRSTTIDVQCANTKTLVLSANSPGACQYHLSMKSYYGCPAECPVTENGLCNSHGHCSYDSKLKVPYCFCNEGHYGVDCSSNVAPKIISSSFDGRSVQIGLLVTLLIVMLGMIAAVGYMAWRIHGYRK
ncbi:MAG: hypothetical protein EBZ77_15145, partial [Chitinophagia bacterium]|nr:hypothetical protein [Chitinophagia bacterium]